MTWIDIAGRWLIVGIGLAAGVALLLYIWNKVIMTLIDYCKAMDMIVSYAIHRKEFKEWRKNGGGKRPSGYKLSEEEEKEYKRIHTYKLTEEEKQELREMGSKKV